MEFLVFSALLCHWDANFTLFSLWDWLLQGYCPWWYWKTYLYCALSSLGCRHCSKLFQGLLCIWKRKGRWWQMAGGKEIFHNSVPFWSDCRSFLPNPTTLKTLRQLKPDIPTTNSCNFDLDQKIQIPTSDRIFSPISTRSENLLHHYNPDHRCLDAWQLWSMSVHWNGLASVPK